MARKRVRELRERLRRFRSRSNRGPDAALAGRPGCSVRRLARTRGSRPTAHPRLRVHAAALSRCGRRRRPGSGLPSRSPAARTPAEPAPPRPGRPDAASPGDPRASSRDVSSPRSRLSSRPHRPCCSRIRARGRASASGSPRSFAKPGLSRRAEPPGPEPSLRPAMTVDARAVGPLGGCQTDSSPRRCPALAAREWT